MRVATITIVILLVALAVAWPTEYISLTDDQKQRWKDGVLSTAMDALATPPDDAQEALAQRIISIVNPPYEKLWDMARATDNSGLTCGSVAGVDVDIDTCTVANVEAIVAGPFHQLADSMYPGLAAP